VFRTGAITGDQQIGLFGLRYILRGGGGSSITGGSSGRGIGIGRGGSS
jgi:hypothetical protein